MRGAALPLVVLELPQAPLLLRRARASLGLLEATPPEPFLLLDLSPPALLLRPRPALGTEALPLGLVGLLL